MSDDLNAAMYDHERSELARLAAADPLPMADDLLKRIRSEPVPAQAAKLLLSYIVIPASMEEAARQNWEIDLWQVPGLVEFQKRYNAALKAEMKQKAKSRGGQAGNIPHRELVEKLIHYMNNQRRVVVNAALQFSDAKTWKAMPKVTARSLAQDFAFSYRENQDVKTERVVETIEVLARRQRDARLRALVEMLTGKPSSGTGRHLLIAFLTALTGIESPIQLAVLRHWIWNVKRSLVGLPREHDIMPVIIGEQGSGKSTAVQLLCGPLLELVTSVNVETLTDGRRTPELETFFVGIWDEMEGADRGDVEALKNTISCTTRSYRPMGTNLTALAVRSMSFIGTSNKSISTMIRDTTGARRFFEIESLPLTDREALNGIDYSMLWTAVSEKDPCPILGFLDELRAAQASLRYQDTVSMWLENEPWRRLVWEPRNSPSTTVPDYSPGIGHPYEDMRARYACWCYANSEQVMGGQTFKQRLTQEGFIKHRPSVSGKRPWLYLRPGDGRRGDPATASEGTGGA